MRSVGTKAGVFGIKISFDPPSDVDDLQRTLYYLQCLDKATNRFLDAKEDEEDNIFEAFLKRETKLPEVIFNSVNEVERIALTVHCGFYQFYSLALWFIKEIIELDHEDEDYPEYLRQVIETFSQYYDHRFEDNEVGQLINSLYFAGLNHAESMKIRSTDGMSIENLSDIDSKTSFRTKTIS